ncbi:retrovirus-related pol polyprotein from transposon TNT 1-94 [Tanacetum coccineum]
MIGQRSLLINFVSKFMGTVRFRNAHVVAIRGYGDYQIRNVTISRVYYVEGLGHNLFSVGQFCESDLEVAFRKHTCYVRDMEGVDLLKGTRGSNLYTMSLWNRTLVEAAHMMLIFSKALLFLWAKAVVTVCYTQNHSLIRICHNKIPYELIHDRKHDLTYFYVFGTLCYPTNDGEDPGKLKPKANIRIFVGYIPSKKAYRIYNNRTRLSMETIHVEFDELTAMDFEQFGSGLELQLMNSASSGLVKNPHSSTPYIPPTKNDWDMFFQPMFNEYFNPPPSVVSLVTAATTKIPAHLTGSPSSTPIDQVAPSASTSSTIHESQSPIICEGVEEQLQPA